MSDFHPYSWSDFPTELVFYFIFGGPFHLAFFVIGTLVFAGLAIRQRGTFLRRVGRFGLFLGILLVTGAVANGIWSCTVYGRLYYEPDYVCGFAPFWPITQNVIDAKFGWLQGRLIGVSLFQLQLVWLLFAVPTWAATIFLFRLIRSCAGNRSLNDCRP